MKNITLKDKKILETKLQRLLKDLEEWKEKKIFASAEGDFSENEEYKIAKSTVSKLMYEIADIKDKLTYDIVDKVSDKIDLGSSIHLRVTNIETKEIEFENDLDISALDDKYPDEGVLSDTSPLFSSIRGQKSFHKDIVGADNVKRHYDCDLRN